MCEICSKLTIKTPELCQWSRSGALIFNFEQSSYIVLVFLLLTLNKLMPVGWKALQKYLFDLSFKLWNNSYETTILGKKNLLALENSDFK